MKLKDIKKGLSITEYLEVATVKNNVVYIDFKEKYQHNMYEDRFPERSNEIDSEGIQVLKNISDTYTQIHSACIIRFWDEVTFKLEGNMNFEGMYMMFDSSLYIESNTEAPAKIKNFVVVAVPLDEDQEFYTKNIKFGKNIFIQWGPVDTIKDGIKVFLDAYKLPEEETECPEYYIGGGPDLIEEALYYNSRCQQPGLYK